MISRALLELGYKNFYVVNDEFEGINWIIEPEKKPTKKQVMDMVSKLPQLLEAEQQAKQATLDSAIAKLAKLGLTEDEAKAIVGIQ